MEMLPRAQKDVARRFPNWSNDPCCAGSMVQTHEFMLVDRAGIYAVGYAVDVPRPAKEDLGSRQSGG